jgi:hypothetical protein
MYSTSDIKKSSLQLGFCEFIHMGTTIIQYEPGVSVTLNPVTWTVYSVKPYGPVRPVGVLVAGEVPESTTIPA